MPRKLTMAIAGVGILSSGALANRDPMDSTVSKGEPTTTEVRKAILEKALHTGVASQQCGSSNVG